MSAPRDPAIVSERVFDASPEEIFRAFGDPARLAAWWGPRGFTNRFEEFDFRPGGAWRFVMYGPDGAEYRLEKEFVEVAPPERLVIRQVDANHGFTMTITLAGEGARTRMTWRMLFDDPEEGERAREFIAGANEENFDRLEAHLAATRSASR